MGSPYKTKNRLNNLVKNEYKKIIENEEEEVNNKDNKIEKIEEKSKEMISGMIQKTLLKKESLMEYGELKNDYRCKNIWIRRKY